MRRFILEREALFRLKVRYKMPHTIESIKRQFKENIGDAHLSEITLVCDHPIVSGKEALDLYGQLDCIEDDL